MRRPHLGVALVLVATLLGCQSASGRRSANAANPVPIVETGRLGTAEIGSRVSIQGQVTRVQDDSPYGHKLWVDDGTGEAQVFIDASTELIRHTGSWRVADRVRVDGLVAKYGTTYELLPKTGSDIVVVERVAN